eukprot:m.20699 g.20699  ORF g.20699 m.20699 type:complete len:499 (-) comp6925_c0_seq1:1439-2935(-)
MPKERIQRDQLSEKKVKVIMKPEEVNTRHPKPWTGLDMSGVGLLVVNPDVFKLKFLTFIYLNHNNLSFIPPEICELESLTLLDLSHNKLRSLPSEFARLRNLRELLLFHNILSTLPFELGLLFQLVTLGLHGNPLSEPLMTYSLEGTESVMSYLLDNSPISEPPPERLWIPKLNQTTSTEQKFTVFCYNVLFDKFATRQLYGYCPSWALDWDYRKQQIIKDISTWSCDLVLLQEVGQGDFYDFFLGEMQSRGYEGIYRPKSRSRNMNEHDKKTVDGCAIFWTKTKFELKMNFLCEFGHLGAQHGAGSSDMLNRVMPKDNIAVTVLLEYIPTKRQVLVTNAHLTWDPEFKDVKVIQAIMLLEEVSKIIDQHCKSAKPAVIVGGDFNSMPDSGVFEFLTRGRISQSHTDFKSYDYQSFSDKVGFSHDLKLQSVYNGEMPYTNYTNEFKGIIDYVFVNTETIAVKSVLGPVDVKAMESFDGCPNPHFPSDHFSLATELTLK